MMKSRWFGLAATIIILAFSSIVILLAAPTLAGTKSNTSNSSIAITSNTSSNTTRLDCDHAPTTANVVKGDALAEADPQFNTATAGYDVVPNGLGVSCSSDGFTVNAVFDLHSITNGTVVKQLVVQEDPTLSYLVQMSFVLKPWHTEPATPTPTTSTTITTSSITPIQMTNTTTSSSS